MMIKSLLKSRKQIKKIDVYDNKIEITLNKGNPIFYKGELQTFYSHDFEFKPSRVRFIDLITCVPHKDGWFIYFIVKVGNTKWNEITKHCEQVQMHIYDEALPLA